MSPSSWKLITGQLFKVFLCFFKLQQFMSCSPADSCLLKFLKKRGLACLEEKFKVSDYHLLQLLLNPKFKSFSFHLLQFLIEKEFKILQECMQVCLVVPTRLLWVLPHRQSLHMLNQTKCQNLVCLRMSLLNGRIMTKQNHLKTLMKLLNTFREIRSDNQLILKTISQIQFAIWNCRG